MGGHSGTRVAAHTPLVHFGGHTFAVSPAQMRILKRAQTAGGACYVKGIEERSAQTLVSLRFGTTEPGMGSEGQTVYFRIAAGVST